jgi:predicted permease
LLVDGAILAEYLSQKGENKHSDLLVIFTRRMIVKPLVFVFFFKSGGRVPLKDVEFACSDTAGKQLFLAVEELVLHFVIIFELPLYLHVRYKLLSY